ncbi:uncharacterized protein [Argopecten irradians]|uniref:uncharacterized protein isoform X1 n=1 Tax=Argopecten irradians TaxID=31199 RepID=UPI0037129476
MTPINVPAIILGVIVCILTVVIIFAIVISHRQRVKQVQEHNSEETTRGLELKSITEHSHGQEQMHDYEDAELKQDDQRKTTRQSPPYKGIIDATNMFMLFKGQEQTYSYASVMIKEIHNKNKSQESKAKGIQGVLSSDILFLFQGSIENTAFA